MTARGTEYRDLLRALETTYSGIMEEFDRVVGARDDIERTERPAAREARTNLRRKDMYPPLFDYQLDLVEEFLLIVPLCSAKQHWPIDPSDGGG